MFQASVDELRHIAVGILQVQERHRLRLFTRRDVYGRFVTALVYVPRDRYNTELRIRMQDILVRALDAQSENFWLSSWLRDQAERLEKKLGG